MKTNFRGAIRKIKPNDKGSYLTLENEITGETKDMFLYMKLPQDYIGYHADITSSEKRMIIEPEGIACRILSEQEIKIVEAKSSVKLRTGIIKPLF